MDYVRRLAKNGGLTRADYLVLERTQALLPHGVWLPGDLGNATFGTIEAQGHGYIGHQGIGAFASVSYAARSWMATFPSHVSCSSDRDTLGKLGGEQPNRVTHQLCRRVVLTHAKSEVLQSCVHCLSTCLFLLQAVRVET